MNTVPLPKQEELKTIFAYDKRKGVLVRKVNTSSIGRLGTCGHLDRTDGYRKIYVAGIRYKMHRLIYKFFNGDFDESLHVDHINGDRSDNRIKNLRIVMCEENTRNRKLSTKNTSGYMGVSYVKKCGKWKASVGYNGKDIHLGFFDKIEDAIKARKEADRKYGFHKNHGRAV